MDEQNGSAETTKPTIHVEFAAPLSAEINIAMDGCTAPQMWAAAELIKHYADDFYAQQQMQKAMANQQQPTLVPAPASALDLLRSSGSRRIKGID